MMKSIGRQGEEEGLKLSLGGRQVCHKVERPLVCLSFELAPGILIIRLNSKALKMIFAARMQYSLIFHVEIGEPYVLPPLSISRSSCHPSLL